MPNHYTTMAICSPGYEFDVNEFNCKHSESNLCAIVKPMPERLNELTIAHGSPDWYEWANKHWGTKWGVYGVQAFALGGDHSPILIKFQSAWCHPNNLDDIAKWLCKTFLCETVAFVGFEPYDESVSLIEVFKTQQ